MIGVHSNYSEQESHAGWQRLADFLSQQVSDKTVKIIELSHNDMEQALHNHQLDFLLTDPAIYYQIKTRNSLANAVATVRGIYRQKPVMSLGGAIIARGDRTDLSKLHDLKGKHIAIEGREHISSFQSHAHMLFEANIDVNDDMILQTVQATDEMTIIDVVMKKHVDGAFIRAGLLEKLIDQGRLNKTDLKVINQQKLPGFPFAVSTRLYPERPLIMLPHVQPHVAQELVTALYSLKRSSPLLTPLNIYHFRLPVNYNSIAEVARELHLPPFDVAPEVSLTDIWARYNQWIIIILVVLISISILSTGLIISNQRLRLTRDRLDERKHALIHSEAQLHNSLEELKKSTERLKLVIQASNDGIWDWDVIADKFYYSPRWKSMLGYQDHELENSFSTWESLVDKNDIKPTMDLIDDCINGVSSGFEVEFRMRHKDGHWVDILSRGRSVRNSKNKVIRFAGTHVDLTEYKKLERSLREQKQELSQIIDHIPSMIFLKEAKELRYVRFNYAGEKLTGLKEEDMIGLNDLDFFPEEQANFFNERDRAVIASGKFEDIPQERIDTPTGTRILHTRKIPIHDEKGKPKYLLGISDDITEQLGAEIEHNRLQRELQQSQKMDSLGQLTGGIAHDFNNLLGIISGYTDLTLDDCEKNGQQKLVGYMRHATEACNRATNLVAQMLDFSRLDQAGDTPIELAPLLRTDINLVRASLPSSIDINSDIESGLPNTIMNPTQLHQILMNLSINARDAMKGAGKLNIRLGWARNLDTESPVSHKPVKGDWIELSVSDTGTGMSTQVMKHIFDPFYTTKEVGKGTGMGLSVIYSIMKNHNGHILLDSKEGQGSTFRILFPPHFGEIDTESNTAIFSKEISTGNNKEILIVDDEPALSAFMSELLKSYDYQTTVMTQSTKALDLFLEEPERFSILITDQTMPEMTGIELILKLGEIRPELPIILCSGYSNIIDLEVVNKFNVHLFDKPVDKNKLLSKISELINK